MSIPTYCTSVRLRYVKPLMGLVDAWHVKSIAAGLLTWLSELGLLLRPEPKYIQIIVFLMVADLVFGVWRAFRRGEAIASVGLRQTAVKFIEYSVLVAIATGIGSTFPDEVGFLSKYACLYIALTEGHSIVENMTGKTSVAGGIWSAIQKEIQQRTGSSFRVKEDDGEADK